MTFKGFSRYAVRPPYSKSGWHATRPMARAAHAGCATRPAQAARLGYIGIARLGYADRGMIKPVFAVRRRRPLAACMVKDAPRNGGALGWHTQNLAGARPARTVPTTVGAMAPSAAAGERRGAESAADGVMARSRGERAYHEVRVRPASWTCSWLR